MGGIDGIRKNPLLESERELKISKGVNVGFPECGTVDGIWMRGVNTKCMSRPRGDHKQNRGSGNRKEQLPRQRNHRRWNKKTPTLKHEEYPNQL